jgi:plastocyanin
MPHPTTAARLLALPLLLAVLSACGGGSDDASTATTSSSPASSSAASPSAEAAPPTGAPTPAAASPATPPPGASFTVAYDGAQVTGDTGRLTVDVGETVTITVTSTVADEVHLHGYDLSAPVSQAAPAVLTFEASIPGVFEVELEELGKQLASLQVQ